MEKHKNIFIAILACIVLWLGMELWLKPLFTQTPVNPANTSMPAKSLQTPILIQSPPCTPKLSREDSLRSSSEQRVVIDTPYLAGSISLKGALLDDMVLRNYKATVDKGSPPVVILFPPDTQNAYYSTFRWEILKGSPMDVPSNETVWTADTRILNATQPVVLRWTNAQGVEFQQIMSIEGYMVKVHQILINTTAQPLSIRTFGLLERLGPLKVSDQMVLHEGPLGVFQGRLREISYAKCLEPSEQAVLPLQSDTDRRGWLGITDKYWLGALILDSEGAIGRFVGTTGESSAPIYRAETFSPPKEIAPGERHEAIAHFFVGPKQVDLLDAYEEKFSISKFDLAVDFGWFYFITKPLFYLLSWLREWGGSFAFAILAMTVLIRLLFLPLSIKSQRSMTKMRAVQPKMQTLKELYKDDKTRLNQEIMLLYKKEGISPVSGCLPMLVQLPFFFALYKVLFISIEMRHASFWGWIQDLSAPDPTCLFTGFGLIPWDVPSALHIGAWPVIMGITMLIQQRMNDSPTMEPTQRAMLTYVLPVVFSYMFAQFPVGLVIYWTWGNILTVVQQWVLTRWIEGWGSRSSSSVSS